MPRIVLLIAMAVTVLAEPVQLFNGKDLSGWSATAHPQLWQVENGDIVGRWDKPDDLKAHSFLVHDRILDDFHLRFEVKLEDNVGNSGVQFRSKRLGAHNFQGYQADIGPGWWGKLYDEHGKGRGDELVLWKKSGEPFIKPSQWNVYEIIAVGNRIQTTINGNLSVDYTDDGSRATSGVIALQLHWGLRAKEIRFRNIELLPEPKVTAAVVNVSCAVLSPGQRAPLQLADLPYPIRTDVISEEQHTAKSQSKEGSFSAAQLRIGNVVSPILTAEQQLEQFELPDGFEIELVASERLGMRKIVDIAFDTRGRMWASTATEYPADSFDEKINFGQMLKRQGVKRSARVEALWRDGGVDQILIFDNPTAKRVKPPILFSEGHAMPMGVLPYQDGAIVIEGERLKYLADTNGDDRADEVTLLADGFGAQDTHTGAHGLKYMPGDWITIINGVLNWGDVVDASGTMTTFDRTGVAYIRPDGQDFHVVQKGFQNIWGFLLDVEGKTWMHEANNVGYPLAPFYEHFGVPMTTAKELLYRDYMTLYPPLGNVNLEGSSLSGLERSEDLVGGFPAEWQNYFFIAHPSPRKIHALSATQRPDQSYELKRGPDLLISKDPNFRPIDLEFGPDGCLYVVDWYNPVISHNEVQRDHPLRNKFHSRIWRIRHASQAKYPVPADLGKAATTALPGHLESGNAWELRSAWKEIAYRQDKSVLPAVKALVENTAKPARHRIHALWSMESLGAFDWTLWQKLLRDDSENVRAEALRSLRKLQPDLRVTFDALVALKTRETRFHVNKALFNYFVDATHLSADHIDWLMQWRRPAPKLGKKVIWHQVPAWADYPSSHYSDMVRIALEAQPAAVRAYVQDPARNGETKQFLTRSIIPRLASDGAAADPTNGLKPADLASPDVRKMVLAKLGGAPEQRLAVEYWKGLAPIEAVNQVINSDAISDTGVAQTLLATPVAKLGAAGLEDLASTTALIKALLFLQKRGANPRAWAPARSVYTGQFGARLGKAHPTLAPLLVRLGVDVPGMAETSPVHAVAWMRALDRPAPPNLVASFESIIAKADVARRTQFGAILAESPRAFTYLLNALGNAPKGYADLSFDFVSFLHERYDQTVASVPALKTQAAPGFAVLQKQLATAKAQELKKIDSERDRLMKVGQSLTAKPKSSAREEGKMLFKGLCLSCHQFGDEGAGIGPSLDGSENRALDALVTAVVDPDAASEANYRRVRVQLLDGTTREGLFRPDSNGGVSLYYMGGGKIDLAASDIAYIHSSVRSFMPSDLSSSLSDDQVANLLAYIKGPSVSVADAEKPSRPNVVIIFADDLGYGDVGCYGATKVQTPHIDRLAKEGRKFTDAHAAAAVCTPSRYALLTGRYAARENIFGPTGITAPLLVDPERTTVADIAKEAGYATGCIGKWHLGFGLKKTNDWKPPLKGPLLLGFDYYFGVPIVNSAPPYVYVENETIVKWDENDPIIYGKDQKTHTKYYDEKVMVRIGGAKAAHEHYVDELVGTTLAGKAVDWIREKAKADNPFFLYLATTNIHHPFTPAPRFQGTSQAGLYGDFIHELDWMVGEVMKQLDESGVADNTLVIFTSDNGGMLNRGGQAAWKKGHRLNGDLLGFKFDAWEGGHRVPFIVRWPGRVEPGSVSSSLISNVDFLATMAAITGRKLKANEGPDSFNLVPAFTSAVDTRVRDHLLISPFWKTHLSLRQDDWVYIPVPGNGGFRQTKVGDHGLGGPAAHLFTGQTHSDIKNGKLTATAPKAQLYNLAEDPFQKVNVIREHPERANLMKKELARVLAKPTAVHARKAP